MFPKIKAAVKGFRAKRKFEKGKIIMPGNPKPLIQDLKDSKTTRDVAAGAVISGGTAYGLLVALRALVGNDSMPWSAETDTSIAVAATAILTPLVSRVKAWFRRGSQ